MINLTDRAALELRRAIEDYKKNEQDFDHIYVRVGVKGGGCSGFQYVLALEDGKNDRDDVHVISDLDFIIDKVSTLYMEGVSLDFADELSSRGFKFRNSLAKSTCGCGSSFSV